jgi:AraC-like DNA-binding protein
MENLFYLEEHVSCQWYKSGFQTGFKTNVIREGEMLEKVDMSYNHLIFVREGLITIDCNEYSGRKVKKDECILIPRAADMSCRTLQDSSLLVLTFDVLQSICDKSMLRSYESLYKQIDYSFTPTPIRYPLTTYIDLLMVYLKEGINCEHLHEIKEKELFLVLRRCYSREEIMHLLHPIIGVSDFKALILQNYMKVQSVSELAELTGLGRTAFDTKFRDVFGMSARQWILKEMAKRIRYRAKDPAMSIRRLITEFKFNSATHFYRFCKQQFDCTPTELLKKSRG